MQKNDQNVSFPLDSGHSSQAELGSPQMLRGQESVSNST